MEARPPARGHLFRYRQVGMLLLAIIVLFFLQPVEAREEYGDVEQQRIETAFPQADEVSEPEGDYFVRTISLAGGILGYAFQSLDVVDIPAYSGKPVNIQVLMDAAGVIQDAYVLEHHEPILLIGIPEERLHEFTAKYQGISADQLVVVGRSSDPDAVTVDAVTGATVTVMVVNEIIMRSAHDVAVALGLVEASAGAVQKPAVVREDVFEPASWSELTGNGAIRRLHLTHGDVDEAFKGTEAEGLDEATPEEAGKNFIDLYVAHLNPPTISRNLLGENQYRFLMEELEAGEHAVAVLGRGEYSFKVPAMCMAGSSIGYSCVNSATSSASAIGITSGWLTCTPKECPNSPKWQSSSSVSTTGFWGEGHKRSEVF